MSTSSTKLQCPIAIEWPIPENRLRELKDKLDECLLSDLFKASNIPGVQYFIGIFPNEKTDKFSGEACVYLYLAYSEDRQIKADFDIKIESTNISQNVKYTFTSTYGWGTKICTTDELFNPENRFIVDGQLTIKMNGILTVEKKMPKKKNESFGDHRDALCLGLWNQEEEKDFMIVSDGKEIMAHKSVLATRSPVFARMFQSRMKETQENKVEIKDFSFEVVEMGIKYCYHQSLVTESSLEQKMQLLQFFDKYDIQPLKDDLEIYMIGEICVSTVCRLTNASLLSNSSTLKKKCTEFLRSSFGNKPVSDLDILDDEFALKLFKNSFFHVSK